MLKFLNFAAACLIAAPVVAGDYGLGRPATPEEVAAWDIDIRPDGQGLPDGSGNVMDGEEIYTDNCAFCHGDFGEAVGRWPVLAGGDDTLASEDPVKTVGSYWPYLSTVYDYVHRAMPFGNAQSLTDNEVYAITAYILYLNDLVDEDFELSRENFTEIRLPNEDNFFLDDRPETELAAFSGEVCMSDCKETVEITARARVIDVTPENAGVIATGNADLASLEDAPAPVEEVMVAIDDKLAAKGEKVFRKCKACHQVGEEAVHRSGPHLNGLLGRMAGGAEGFQYSKAMEAAGENGLIWTETELANFLARPKEYMKGTKMSFAGLRKVADVAAVTEYLKTFAE